MQVFGPLTALIASTALYYFLHRKTRMRLKLMYIDNAAVTASGAMVSEFLLRRALDMGGLTIVILTCMMVVLSAFVLTMMRFWRAPVRRCRAAPGEIVSPADGRIIYIREGGEGSVPSSEKAGSVSMLPELTEYGFGKKPYLQVGINMTPFDVHKNCSPASGKILMSKHTPGKFLSLKDRKAFGENERHTYVISSEGITAGVVQTASRLVRRIDSYVKPGDIVSRGKWIGMIRFGSQVDLFLPFGLTITATEGDQVYAGKSVIARL